LSRKFRVWNKNIWTNSALPKSGFHYKFSGEMLLFLPKYKFQIDDFHLPKNQKLSVNTCTSNLNADDKQSNLWCSFLSDFGKFLERFLFPQFFLCTSPRLHRRFRLSRPNRAK